MSEAPVVHAESIATALRAALMARGDPDGEVQQLRRLTGGATKQTWSFDWVSGDRRKTLILQQIPARDSSPSASRAPKLNAEQDATLMKVAREGGVPAPAVHLVLQPQDGLGDGYVTGYVQGETLGRRIVQDPSFEAARRVMARQCGAILAAIHRLPGPRLHFLKTLSPADELAVYGALLQPFGLNHPAMAYALRWVEQNLPDDWEPAVVHADFRTGNLIVDETGVNCVLDWEIARVGDPMQDLGVLCMRTWRFGGRGQVGGFGSREELYAAYEAESGRPVDPGRVRFWEAFSNLKWAISCARRGLAVRADGHPAGIELAAIGRRFEEPLWDFFSLIGQPAGGH